MPPLFKEVAGTEKSFRYQQLFRTLRSSEEKREGGSLGLVPASLLLALEAGVSHPKLLSDALWNCRGNEEVLLALEAFAQFRGENEVKTAVKGKAVAAAVVHVANLLPKEEREELLAAIDAL